MKRSTPVGKRAAKCSGRENALWRHLAVGSSSLVTLRVLRELRSLGFAGRLTYKTDADTERGIYGSGAATYWSPPGRQSFAQPERGASAASRLMRPVDSLQGTPTAETPKGA
jgi:hypothetical protein